MPPQTTSDTEGETASGSDGGETTDDPSSDAVYGDGIAESEELCDGADLGGNTCESAGFAGGVGAG